MNSCRTWLHQMPSFVAKILEEVDTSTKVREIRLSCQPIIDTFKKNMPNKSLSPQELRVWYAFQIMGEEVLARVGRDIAQATALSGPEFGVLSRLAALGNGEMR